MEIRSNEVRGELTVGCQHNLHERLVGDFGGRVDHDQDVVGVVVVPEEQQSVCQVIDAVVGDLLGR